MRRVTLVLENQINGGRLKDIPYEALKQQLNQAIPAARWAYLGYLDNRFCMDSVVSEQRCVEVRRQAARVPYVARVLDEPWPAGKAAAAD